MSSILCKEEHEDGSGQSSQPASSVMSDPLHHHPMAHHPLAMQHAMANFGLVPPVHHGNIHHSGHQSYVPLCHTNTGYHTSMSLSLPNNCKQEMLPAAQHLGVTEPLSLIRNDVHAHRPHIGTSQAYMHRPNIMEAHMQRSHLPGAHIHRPQLGVPMSHLQQSHIGVPQAHMSPFNLVRNDQMQHGPQNMSMSDVLLNTIQGENLSIGLSNAGGSHVRKDSGISSPTSQDLSITSKVSNNTSVPSNVTNLSLLKNSAVISHSNAVTTSISLSNKTSSNVVGNSSFLNVTCNSPNMTSSHDLTSLASNSSYNNTLQAHNSDTISSHSNKPDSIVNSNISPSNIIQKSLQCISEKNVSSQASQQIENSLVDIAANSESHPSEVISLIDTCKQESSATDVGEPIDVPQNIADIDLRTPVPYVMPECDSKLNTNSDKLDNDNPECTSESENISKSDSISGVRKKNSSLMENDRNAEEHSSNPSAIDNPKESSTYPSSNSSCSDSPVISTIDQTTFNADQSSDIQRSIEQLHSNTDITSDKIVTNCLLQENASSNEENQKISDVDSDIPNSIFAAAEHAVPEPHFLAATCSETTADDDQYRKTDPDDDDDYDENKKSSGRGDTPGATDNKRRLRPKRTRICYDEDEESSLRRPKTRSGDQPEQEKPEPVGCSQCKFSTTSLQALDLHYRTKHLGEKLFKCTYCKYSSTERKGLRRHIRTVHCAKKPFKCPEPDCDYAAALPEYLNKHDKVKHGGRNPMKCPECDFTATHIYKIMRHARQEHSTKAYKKILQKKNSRERVGLALSEDILEFGPDIPNNGCPEDGNTEPNICVSNFCCVISNDDQFEALNLDDEENFKPIVTSDKMEYVEMEEEPSNEDLELEPYGTLFPPPASEETTGDMLQCPICGFSTSVKRQLDAHFRTVHPGEKVFKCTQCKFSTSLKKSLKRHIAALHAKEKTYKCPECDYITGLPQNLTRHDKKKHGGRNPKRCPECPFTTTMQRKLDFHIRCEHFKCPHCEFVTSQESLLDTHLESHANDTVYQCHLCKFSSLNENLYKRHLQSRHSISDELPVGADKIDDDNILEELESLGCFLLVDKMDGSDVKKEGINDKENKGRRTRGVRSSNDEMESLNFPADDSGRPEPTYVDGEDTPLYKCVECDFTAGRSSVLKLHEMSKHSKSKPFKCVECDYQGATLGYLVRHDNAVHEGRNPPKCSFCEFTSPSLLELHQHARTHIVDENNDCDSNDNSGETCDVEGIPGLLKCTMCSFTTTNKRQLNVHFATEHPGEKVFKCAKCKFAATMKKNLQRHMVAIHGTEKIYKCPEEDCDYTTGLPQNLTRHDKKKHGGRNPKRCPECNFSTTMQRKLDFHIRCEHYKCPHCDFVTSQESDLYTHIETHSQDTPYKCNLCKFSTLNEKIYKRHLQNKHATSDENLFNEDKAIEELESLGCFVSADRLNVNVKKEALAREQLSREYPSFFYPKLTSLMGNTEDWQAVCEPGRTAHEAATYETSRPNQPTGYDPARQAGAFDPLRQHATYDPTRHNQTSPYDPNRQTLPIPTYDPTRPPQTTAYDPSRSSISYDPNRPQMHYDHSRLPASYDPMEQRGEAGVAPESGKQFYRCSQCDYTATCSSSLKLHELSNHSNPYKCIECEFQGTSLGNLVKHDNEMHESRNPPKCSFCDFSSSSLKDLLRHARGHKNSDNPEQNICDLSDNSDKNKKLGLGPVQKCSLCEYSTNSEREINSHFRSEHPGQKVFKCTQCKFATSLKKSLKRHIAALHGTEKTYKCPECDFVTGLPEKLTRHDKQKHEGRNPKRCPECDFTTTMQKKLDFHIRCEHFKCPHCDYITSYEALLITHLKTHEGDPIYKCNKCKFNTWNEEQYKKHLSSIHGIDVSAFPTSPPRQQAASTTTMNITSPSTLNNVPVVAAPMPSDPGTSMAEGWNGIAPSSDATHAQSSLYTNNQIGYDQSLYEPFQTAPVTSDSDKQPDTSDPNDQAKQRVYRCVECNFSAGNGTALKLHIYSKHSNAKLYKCPECEFQTTTFGYLVKHDNTFHNGRNPPKCSFCEFTTTSLQELHKHTRAHSIVDSTARDPDKITPNDLSKAKGNADVLYFNLLKCTVCDFSTMRKRQLDLHFKTEHAGQKVFKCAMCKFSTAMKKSLKRHMVAIHGRRKKIYKCPEPDCDYTTGLPQNLTRHDKKKHEGRNPKRCPLCPFTTTMQRKLEFHVRTEHFKCPYCNMVAPEEAPLLKHLRVHKKVSAYRCYRCKFLTRNEELYKKHLLVKHDIDFSLTPPSAAPRPPSVSPAVSVPVESSINLTTNPTTVSDTWNNVEPTPESQTQAQEQQQPQPQQTPFFSPTLPSQPGYHQFDAAQSNSYWQSPPNEVMKFEPNAAPEQPSQQKSAYKCVECDYSANNGTSLKLHIYSKHSNAKPYKCVECEFQTTAQHYLVLHDKNMHEGRNPPKCPVCEFTSPSLEEIRNHTRRIHPEVKRYECSMCDHVSFQKWMFDRHMRYHMAKQCYKCPKCDFSTFRLMTFKTHLAKKHSMSEVPKSLLRNSDKISLKNAAAMRTKTTGAPGGKIFRCSQCNYLTKTKYCLVVHFERNHRRKLYKCSDCSYSATSAIDLRKHAVSHSNNQIFRCPDCPFTTKFRLAFKYHHARKHLAIKPFRCSNCDMAFGVKTDLVRHYRRKHVEELQLKCSDCNFSTHDNNVLNRHYRNRHTMDKPFKCGQCEYAGASEKDLSVHIKRNHSEQNRLWCSVCYYSTGNKQLMKNHYARKHAKLKPFKCSQCEYAGATRDDLTRHSRRHQTGDGKPFKCAECDFTSRNQKYLNTHVFEKHSRDRPFMCSKCSFCASLGEDLKAHLLTAHVEHPTPPPPPPPPPILPPHPPPNQWFFNRNFY